VLGGKVDEISLVVDKPLSASVRTLLRRFDVPATSVATPPEHVLFEPVESGAYFRLVVPPHATGKLVSEQGSVTITSSHAQRVFDLNAERWSSTKCHGKLLLGEPSVLFRSIAPARK
jgi:hypothetical protein